MKLGFIAWIYCISFSYMYLTNCQLSKIKGSKYLSHHFLFYFLFFLRDNFQYFGSSPLKSRALSYLGVSWEGGVRWVTYCRSTSQEKNVSSIEIEFYFFTKCTWTLAIRPKREGFWSELTIKFFNPANMLLVSS